MRRGTTPTLTLTVDAELEGWGLGTGLLDIMEDVRNGGTLSR